MPPLGVTQPEDSGQRGVLGWLYDQANQRQPGLIPEELNPQMPGPRGVTGWLYDQAQSRLFAEPQREYVGNWTSPQQMDRYLYGTVDPSERDRFGLAGIEQQNRAEAATTYVAPAGRRTATTGRPWVAVPDWEPGVSVITPADARAELPLASNMGWTAKQDFVMSNYPNLFKAAQAANLTQDEVYEVTNFTLAVDAARTIQATVNPLRQRQLMMSMPIAQRALVADVLTAMGSEAMAGDSQVTTGSEVAQVNSNPALTARANAGEEQNPVLSFFRSKFWDPSIDISALPMAYSDTNWGPIENGELYIGGRGAFDALVSANEMALRGTNALMLTSAAGSWERAWNSTEAGTFDPEMLDLIKQNNDPLLVQVMVDIKKAAARQDDDPIGGLLEKYGNNPQALAYIDRVLLNTDPNSDISKLAGEIDAAELSNLMNVAMWSFGAGFGIADATTYEGIESYAGSDVTRVAGPLGNVSLTFLLDPTIAATGVRAARMAAKYGFVEPGVERGVTAVGLKGMETWARVVGNTDVIPALREARLGLGIMQPGRLDTVFSTKGAQNFFNYLGSQFDRVRAIEDVGDQAQVFNSLASQNRRWFSPASLKVMMDAGVKDYATARAFFDDAANMEHLLLGQAGRRTKGYVIPHMTVGYATVKRGMLSARGMTTKTMGGSGYLDAVFGPGTSQLMPEEAATYLSKKIEEDPAAIGRALSDFVYVDDGGGVRTLTGRIVDWIDRTDRSAPVPEGADPEKWRLRDRYGWMRGGTWADVMASANLGNVLRSPANAARETATSAQRALGRLGRLMAHMPDASRGIPVAGPEGAEMVKELAQAVGMNRYFANYLRYIWPSMTEPQRVRLVNGLNRTGLVTSGVDLVNPALARSLDETFVAVASRTGTQYTASYVDMIRIRANAEKVVARMDAARKAENRARMTTAEREAAVQDEVARIVDQIVADEAARTAAAVEVPEQAVDVADDVAAPVDEVVDEAAPAAEVADEAAITWAEFNEYLSEVMSYSDNGGPVDDAIDKAIEAQEELDDLERATFWLRDAYAKADLDWPAAPAAAPEAEVAQAAPAVVPQPAQAAVPEAEVAPVAAPEWSPYDVEIPERSDELIEINPGDNVTADEVAGARPDLWLQVRGDDDLTTYTISGRREGNNEGVIVRWDADVRDGETPVEIAEGASTADRRAAYDFIQRLDSQYLLLDTPMYKQVIDGAGESLATYEGMATATPIARITLDNVPEGEATWRRAAGPHTEATSMPVGEMAIIRYAPEGAEPHYSAVQPVDKGQPVQIIWYASDGAFSGELSAGVDKNVVEAMKRAIKQWGDETGTPVPTKWKVDPKRPSQAERSLGGPISREANVDGRPYQVTFDEADGRVRVVSDDDDGLLLEWDQDGTISGYVANADEIPAFYSDLLKMADEGDLDVIPSVDAIEEKFGKGILGALPTRIVAEAPDVQTVAGQLVNAAPTGRPEMPMGEVPNLAFPDRGPLKSLGYTSTVQSGKTTKPRAVTVTSQVDAWGVREWRVEVDRQPSQQYGLTADITFDEQGRVRSSAYGLVTRKGEKSPYDAANGYDKRQYALLAKAVAQEAERYDIPIRGQLADWLEQMGVTVKRDPDVWDAVHELTVMSAQQTNDFAEFALRRNPELGDDLRHGETTYSPLIQLGDGTDTYEGLAKVNGRNPDIRRLLAEYLGRVDDPVADTAAPLRVTQPYTGTGVYADNFASSGRPLGGDPNGMGVESALPDEVSYFDPEFKRVPGVEETIDGLTFRLYVGKRRDLQGEVKYTGFHADVAQEGAFSRRGWRGLDGSLSWHPDGHINVNSPVTEGAAGTRAATAREAESIRALEEWVTNVAESYGLDIDMPWAGYYPRRPGNWYKGDPVDDFADDVADEVATEAPAGFVRIPDTWNGDEDAVNDIVIEAGYPRPNRFARAGGGDGYYIDPGYEVFGTTVMRDGEEIPATFVAGTYKGRRVWAITAKTHNVGRKSPYWQDVDKMWDENGRLLGRGDTEEDSKFLLDIGSSDVDNRASHSRPLVEVIVANAEHFGYELKGDLGELVRRLGLGDERSTFAPVPAPPAPTPVIDDIVQWDPNATAPDELAKQVPSGARGKVKSKNAVVAVFKNIDETAVAALMQVIPARGGLWVTDRYRLLRLSDADAEGLLPGRKIVPTRTKATIEKDMRIAAMVSTEDDNYRALEAELQAAIEGRPLADVGVQLGQAPKIEQLMGSIDEVASDGTVFTPTGMRAAGFNKSGQPTSWMVTDGVAYFNAKYYRELPKGAVVKYGKPDKAAAIVDENGELIGMLMPINLKGATDEIPAGQIGHPIHGRQDGWKFTDSEGNTYHFFHKVKEDRNFYQRPQDRPKGPIDYGWWLEMRTKGMGHDSPTQAIAIHWKPDGSIDTEGGVVIEWGARQSDAVKDRLVALADRVIEEQDLPLTRVLGAQPTPAAPSPTQMAAVPGGPTKAFKLRRDVYEAAATRLGLPEPTKGTKTLVTVELDSSQFVALIDDTQALGKSVDETMQPGPAMAAKRKYRDFMQSMWDQGSPPPPEGVAPEVVAPAAAAVEAAAPAVERATTLLDLDALPNAGKGVKSAMRRAKKFPTAKFAAYYPADQELAPGAVVQLDYPENGFPYRPKIKEVRLSDVVPVDAADLSKGFIYQPDPATQAVDEVARAIFYYPTGAYNEDIIEALQAAGMTDDDLASAKKLIFDKADVERYQGSYSDFPAVTSGLPAKAQKVANEVAEGRIRSGLSRDMDEAAEPTAAAPESNVPVYQQTVKPGEYDVDLEAGTMTQREPIQPETEVIPPANLIPEARPVEPEVIEGTVVGGGRPPTQPPAPPSAPGPAGKPRKVPGLSKDEKRAMRRGEIAAARQSALENGDIKNPSSLNETDNYALYDTQLTGTVSILDPSKMNMLMARSSYLNALLGGGPKITTTTDLWTLATLAGPRFVMRSGIEDFALYALTGGQFFGRGGWLDGRRASSAIREATERVEPVGNSPLRGNNPGMKLGLAATARREVGTMLARRMPAFRALVLPYLDEAEVEAATAMASARGSERSRKALADLAATAFARARFFSINRLNWASGKRIRLEGDARYVADVIKDGVERGYLNAQMDRASEVAEHLADGTMPAYKTGAGGTEVIDGTTISHVRTQVQGWNTHWQQGGRNADDVEAFHMELDRSLHQSGYKAYAAIARSRRYYRLKYEIERAVKPETKAQHQQALDEFIGEFAADIANDPELGRYVLVEEIGVEGYAERLLDDALRMMTTSDGYYNNALADTLLLPNYRRVTVSNELAEELGFSGSAKADATTITINRAQWNQAMDAATDEMDVLALREAGEPIDIFTRSGAPSERRYGLYYFDEDGKFHYNVDAETLHDPDIPMPQSVGSADVITVPVSDKIPFTSRAWAAMGRSLARLTREPIYISNYVDAMRLIEPYKTRMTSQLIEQGVNPKEAAELAGDWAAKTASDRAYSLTMAYVDNPAIRSQLAWQVRNVARFYRALEDFYRRMVRVAQYEPDVFWKAALAWNVMDDSGFIWEDEFGDKYFMFPGTQAAFTVVNDLLSRFGIQNKVPGLPMAWGAKVTMLSPSADPNALVPTLGSPYSGSTLKGLLRLLPSVGAMSMEDSQAIEGALFGEYSPQQTFTSSLLNDVAGPNISRVLDALGATRGGFDSRQNESDTMFASVSKQAIHALAASGLFDPSKDYTNEELLELRYMADATAMNLIYLKALLTPTLPATPQPMSLTVSDEARALGIDSGNALFLEYLNKMGSYEDAFIAFTRDNPGKAIFTVSKYENNAYYRQVVEAEEFIRANRDEFEARPVGLSHFAPMEGTFSGMNGFYFMRANGIKVPVTVEEFFNKTMTAAADAEISYVDMIEREGMQGVSAEQRKLMGQVADAMRSDIREKYPLADLGRVIPRDSVKQARRDIDEIVTTAQYIIDSGQDSDGRAGLYLQAYRVYQDVATAKADTEKNSSEREMVNAVWRAWVTDEGMGLFTGDDRGLRFLRTMSSALNTPVEGL